MDELVFVSDSDDELPTSSKHPRNEFSQHSERQVRR